MEQSSAKTVVLGGLAVLLLIIMAPILVIMASDDNSDTDTAAAAGCNPTGGNDVGIPDEYLSFVEDAAEESGLPVALVGGLLKTETGNWDPTAVSPVGAEGLGQFMPGTWQDYGEGGDPFNPEDSIDATGRYLRDLQDMVAPVATTDQERIEFTLAAYNAGPGAVLDHEGIPPYPETQDYVPAIMDLAQVEFSEDCTQPGGSTTGDLGTGEWTHPLPNGQFTSGFGPRPCPAGTECNKYTAHHGGVDFATGGGAQIVAPTDMNITATGANQYQGEYIIGRMNDDPSLVFQFHHCQSGSTSVTQGDTVAVGTDLCIEGNTGNTSGGPNSGHHLHFQINTEEADDSQPTYDYAVDPEPILIEQGIL